MSVYGIHVFMNSNYKMFEFAYVGIYLELGSLCYGLFQMFPLFKDSCRVQPKSKVLLIWDPLTLDQ